MQLKLENIDVFYGEHQVLFDVSLEVREDEIVSIVGSNGSGKTTLFKTISGLMKPTSGKILLNDKRIDGFSPKEIAKMKIAHVPEGRRLFPYMTIKEDLDLGTYVVGSENLEESYEIVFDYFPRLKERLSQVAETLSGGEQQMLAIGRALMMDPRIGLFDEISLGLMPKLVDSIYGIIEQINSDGVPVLFAEQSLERSLEVPDRIYVMRKGEIVLETAADDASLKEIERLYFGVS